MTTTPPTMTLPEQIDFFFAPPLVQQSGFVSSLYLNRREVQDCLLGDVIDEDAVGTDPRRHRLFATVMVISAGIDLLAKFYAGSDKSGGPGGVGDRIVGFAERFMFSGKPKARELAEVIHQGCRNPMLHSFTLHSAKYRMALTVGSALSSGAIWCAPGSPDTFVINVEGLYVAYIGAIRSYEAELRARSDLQADFALMFPAYGGIPVWQAVLERR
jgi:hypothetical protein